uniref:Uncharacterized protein n=1 Tax=Rhipiliopsis peltata TaxID=2320810 RepID=A0A386B184_9CHLO|nr:hypothetical protein [Rhipiliopsis peltata]AYC65455.1 hypothetical protein [Rhipiliopsis peltata]
MIMVLKPKKVCDCFDCFPVEPLKFDYVTLTSKKKSLRRFFFRTLKKIAKDFRIVSCSKHQLRIGGSAYQGFIFYLVNEKGWFLGRRSARSKSGYEYILSIPGEMSNSFIAEFLQDPNFEAFAKDWRFTRLDLQCTLGIEELEVRKLYWEFYNAQRKWEAGKPAKQQREVKLIVEEDPQTQKGFLCVSVGSNKAQRNLLKIYSELPVFDLVRLEITLRKTAIFKRLFRKNDLNLNKMCHAIFGQQLATLAETPLLDEHRSFLKNSADAEPSLQQVKKKAKVQFKEGCVSVAQAHESLVAALKPQMHVFSHQQIRYLNEQFPIKSWQICWANAKQWALIPTEHNALYQPLFAPLPTLKKDYLQKVQKRQAAFLALAKHIDKVTLSIANRFRHVKSHIFRNLAEMKSFANCFGLW